MDQFYNQPRSMFFSPHDSCLVIKRDVRVHIGMSLFEEVHPLRRGHRPPPPIPLNFLLHSDYSITCISQSVADELGLSPYDYVTLALEGEQVECAIYNVSIGIRFANTHIHNWEVAVHPRLDSETCIIGLDILQFSRIIYDGKSKAWSIEIDLPH